MILQATSYIQDHPYDINASEIVSFYTNELQPTIDIDSWSDFDRMNDNIPNPMSPEDDLITGQKNSIQMKMRMIMILRQLPF